jgi:phosphoribosyl 1,2-cyclic phosphate 1,2-diphosphodiesterase
MKADLHLHSTASDGSLTPRELVLQCLSLGLTHISLTDHDTAAGQEEAAAAGREYGIEVIPGIEISAYDFERGRKIHLLGYNFQPSAGNLKALCGPILARRHERTVSHIRILQQTGFPVSLREVEAAAAPSSILYKQHIMKVFVKKGLSAGIYSPLYRKLFKGEGICSADIEYADVFDALAAVIGDGGSAVLAHPGQQSPVSKASN